MRRGAELVSAEQAWASEVVLKVNPPTDAEMPVPHVGEAEHVIVITRSMAAGYAGTRNPLSARDNAQMLFGDAEERVEDIIRAL